MLKGVLNAIGRFDMIGEGDRVVAGVSGGADSVTLLLQLAEYRLLTGYTLQVFHLNHMIRDEAGADEEFVRLLCERLDVPFISEKADVPVLSAQWHMSEEEAGRKIRYDRMRALGADKIAVGHHMDDQAETVLLNMCRGSGLHGMVGIAPVQDDIIRPLIYMTKAEIEAYLKSVDQDWCTDVTNASWEYTRNKLRHHIIPALTEDINGRTIGHIAAIADDMYEIERYIASETDRLYDSLIIEEQVDQGKISLSLKGLRGADPYMLREVLLKAVEKLTPRRKDITRAHITQIADICRTQGEKTLDMPYGLLVRKTYDRLIIGRRRESYEDTGDIFKSDWHDQRKISVPELKEGETWSAEFDGAYNIAMRVSDRNTNKEIPNNTYTKWFDYDKIDWSELCIRYREQGDYLTINDSGSRKTLQDYMVNEKIERSLRASIPLLADGSHIMWVAGYRISSFYKLTGESKRILEVNIIQRQPEGDRS